MKKSSYLIFLLIFMYQVTIAQKFKAGFSGGLVATDIDGSATRDGHHFHKVGVTLGMLVNTEINKKHTFQFEINYINKGSSQPPDSNNMGYYKIALTYIEIPVLIRRKLSFTMRKKTVTKFDFEYGLSAGKLLQHTTIGSSNYVVQSSDKYFNPIDVSLLVGADYHISKGVYFCLRYSNSVIPAVKRNTPNLHFITYTFNRGNNMVLQFSFKFVLSGRKNETVEQPVVPVETDTN